MSQPSLSVVASQTTRSLVPSQLTATRPDFEVVGVFNPAAIRIGEETVLLLRVAEAPRDVPARSRRGTDL